MAITIHFFWLYFCYPGALADLDDATASYVIPSARYADVGGIEHVLQDIREHIEYPLVHPEIYNHIGISPPRYCIKANIAHVCNYN